MREREKSAQVNDAKYLHGLRHMMPKASEFMGLKRKPKRFAISVVVIFVCPSLRSVRFAALPRWLRIGELLCTSPC